MNVLGNFDSWAGLLIVGDNPKEELIKSLSGWIGIVGSPFIKIETPCGNTIIYKTIDDVPMKNIPCPCGRENHWIIKIENSIGENK